MNESEIDMIKKFVKEIVVKTNWDAKYRNVTNYPSSGNKIYFLIKMNKHKVPIPVPIPTQKKTISCFNIRFWWIFYELAI